MLPLFDFFHKSPAGCGVLVLDFSLWGVAAMGGSVFLCPEPLRTSPSIAVTVSAASTRIPVQAHRQA